MTAPTIWQLIPAIYSLLSGKTALTAKLGTYLTKTCIFTGNMIPSSAPKPYVHIRVPSGIIDEGGKSYTVWTTSIEILVVSDDIESSKELIDIVDLIVGYLHKEDLTLTTDSHLHTSCVGMNSANTSNDLIGTILTFNLTYANA